ncbi:hypothetical protein MLD52_12450 [Puniceicoccaceae bacterium K14]|nr:hypothetical protein [Puniceicoccaceae bacterium K14]
MKITRLEVTSFLAGLAIVLGILFSVLEEETNAPVDDSTEKVKETPGSVPLERKSDTDNVITKKPFPKTSHIPPYPTLNRYGTDESSIQEDLKLTQQCFLNFWSLLKDPDLINLASNKSILKSLTGYNPEGIQFIPKNHPFLNERGELLDRWQIPLIFHAIAVNHIEIRSAGPDKIPYTEDDSLEVAKYGLYKNP